MRRTHEATTVWRLTAADLDAYAGRELTDDELERFADAFGNSSVSDSIDTVIGVITSEEMRDA